MPLRHRGRALEEQFFKRKNRQQIEAMADVKRLDTGRKDSKTALAEASGMTDDDVLDRLMELEISAPTVAAVSLVPLVFVAWADGEIQDNERSAIMQAAIGKGIDAGSPAAELLGSWLSEQPGESLLEAWEAYIDTLNQDLTPTQRQILKTQVVDRASLVAQVAGGILGLIRKVSDGERKMIARLAAAFDSAPSASAASASAPSDSAASD